MAPPSSLPLVRHRPMSLSFNLSVKKIVRGFWFFLLLTSLSHQALKNKEIFFLSSLTLIVGF
jgi:hypothetical protein